MREETVTLASREGCGVERENHRIAMLLQNEIAGVLPLSMGGQEGEKRLQYDTEGWVTLPDWCRTRELGERDLRWILTGVLEALKAGEAFLLAPGCYFLCPEHIFLRPSMETVGLCVRPEGDGDWVEEMQEVGRFFLEAIDYKEEDCVKLAYEFYHVGKREGLRPEDYRELLGSRVYTIITDDEEESFLYPKQEELVRNETNWIQIAAAETENFLPELQGKIRKEERQKHWICGGLTAVAVAALLFALYQSGF